MFYRPPAAVCAAAFAVFLGLPIHTRAAEDTVAVPRSEWDALKREMAEMHRELKELKAERSASRPMALAVPFEQRNVVNAAPAPAPEQRGLKAPLAALSKSLTELVSPGQPGTNPLAITGEAAGNWRWNDVNKAGGFDAFFSPELHWQMTDRLSFDAKVFFSLNHFRNPFTGVDYGSDVRLDLAHLNWQVADQFTLILGKFRSPINVYAERYDYAYINPLPDSPLGLYDGVLPEANVGAQLRGEFPLPYRGGAITASAFVSNSPRLGYAGDPIFADLAFGEDNYAVGGRLGWKICPNLEIGYGVEFGKTSYDLFFGGPDKALWLHSIDLQTYLDALRGRWSLRAQYSWSELDADPEKRSEAIGDDTGIVSYAYSTHHHAGYVQASYRGREWETDFLNHLEFIVRGDRLYYSGFQYSEFDYDNGAYPRRITNYPRRENNRLTLGLDYWITDYTVLKAAYEYMNNSSGVVLGFATGL